MLHTDKCFGNGAGRKRTVRGCLQGLVVSGALLLSAMMALHHGQMLYEGVDTEMVEDLIPPARDTIGLYTISLITHSRPLGNWRRTQVDRVWGLSLGESVWVSGALSQVEHASIRIMEHSGCLCCHNAQCDRNMPLPHCLCGFLKINGHMQLEAN